MNKAIICGFNSSSQTSAINECIKSNLFKKSLWISRYSTSKDINFLDLEKLNYEEVETIYIDEYEYFFNKYFNKFIEIYSRSKHTDFSYFEFLNSFNSYFYYMYNLIKKTNTNLVIFSNIPHFGFEYILYLVAKDIFNIKTIIFSQSLFPNKMFYISNLDEYGNFNCLQNLNIKNNTLNIKIKKEFKKELFYMKNIRKKSLKSGCFYRHIIKNFEKILKRKRSCNYSILNFKKCSLYNKNLKKHSQKNINLEENFIYFPLHLQPELTSYILGEKFSDQLLAIEKLSRLIPDNWKIYIKENPKQTHYQRDELFFKRLKKIKNAILVDKHTNTYTLIEKSQFVSTISGTAGWEAISGGKNVLIFGKAWYQNLDGVFKFDNNFKLDAILNYKIEHQKLEKELNKLLSSSFNGIIDENYKQIFNSFDEQENKKNIYFALKTILKEIK